MVCKWRWTVINKQLYTNMNTKLYNTSKTIIEKQKKHKS